MKTTLKAVMTSWKRAPTTLSRLWTAVTAAMTAMAIQEDVLRNGRAEPFSDSDSALPAVAAQGHGRRRDRGGEPDQEGDPAGHEPDRRVKHPGQVVVLAAAAREDDPGLGIGQGAEQGDQAAQGPQHQQSQARGHPGHLEAQAGEDAGPDHVGDDQRRGRRQPELGRLHRTPPGSPLRWK